MTAYPCPSVARVSGHPCHPCFLARRFRSTLSAVLLTAVLSACASPAPPKDNFYRLDVAASVRALDRAVLPGVIEVNRLDVDGALSERGLAYQEKDGALARYSYDLWSDAPATALQLALAETLRHAHAADTVVTPDLRVPPDWTLRGRLYRFEYLPGQGRVAVKMQLAVVSARDGALVLLDTYAAEPLVQGAGPEAAVAALNRAVSDIFTRFISDLAKASIPVQRR